MINLDEHMKKFITSVSNDNVLDAMLHLEGLKELGILDYSMDGYTPLIYCSTFGFNTYVEHLLDAGANIDLSDDDGCTPLYYATIGGHVDTMNLLIKRGSDVNTIDRMGRPLLTEAIVRGTDPLNTVAVLIRNNVDINAQGFGEKALCYAMRKSEMGLANLIKSAGGTW